MAGTIWPCPLWRRRVAEVVTRNREVFAQDPMTTTIPNNGVATVAEGRTTESDEVLRYELRTFVCEGEYARGLRKILDTYVGNVGNPEQPAVWVSGFYRQWQVAPGEGAPLPLDRLQVHRRQHRPWAGQPAAGDQRCAPRALHRRPAGGRPARGGGHPGRGGAGDRLAGERGQYPPEPALAAVPQRRTARAVPRHAVSSSGCDPPARSTRCARRSSAAGKDFTAGTQPSYVCLARRWPRRSCRRTPTLASDAKGVQRCSRHNSPTSPTSP